MFTIEEVSLSHSMYELHFFYIFLNNKTDLSNNNNKNKHH